MSYVNWDISTIVNITINDNKIKTRWIKRYNLWC